MKVTAEFRHRAEAKESIGDRHATVMLEAATMLLDGVFIVASSQLIERSDLDELNKRLREDLAVSR